MGETGPAEGPGLVMSPEAMARLSPAEYFARFLEAGIRPDGRRLDQPRAASLALGSIRSAAGSASARVGSTFVLAGVTCEPVLLGAGADDEGELLICFDAPSISGLRARAPGGAPIGASPAAGLEAQLQANLARSRLLAPGALTIAARRAAWRLTLDVYCLDYGGNLVDAAHLAALGALAHTRLPAAHFDAQAGRVLLGAEATAAAAAEAEAAMVNPSSAQPAAPGAAAGALAGGARLALVRRPVPLSFARVLGHTLADPSEEEESLSDGKPSVLVTVLVDEQRRVAAVHKPGGAPLADADLRSCVDAAQARAPALHRLLDDALALADAVGERGVGVASGS